MDLYEDRINEARTLLAQLEAQQNQLPTREREIQIEELQTYLFKLDKAETKWKFELMHLRADIERTVQQMIRGRVRGETPTVVVFQFDIPI
jgi:hypothetical protein